MVKIDDEVMFTLGKRLDNNTFEFDGIVYKLVRTHQTLPHSYYVALESR